MFKRPSLHPERPFSGTGWRMQPSPPPQAPQYPIPPPGAGPPPYYLPPPMPPRKSRTALIVVIVVVIILVVGLDRKSTRLNSSHSQISYAVFCLKKKNYTSSPQTPT